MENNQRKSINKPKVYGFKIPQIDSTHHVFGGISKIPNIVIQPDGQWDAFLPIDERQNKNGTETYNCTNYGTNHAISVFLKRKFGEDNNFSERFTGVMTETDPATGGNDPQKVAEIIRTVSGEIPESELPFDNTITSVDQYYSPKPMIEPYLTHGKQWLAIYTLWHDWVFTGIVGNKEDLLKEALKITPIGVSVYAWQQNSDSLYYRPAGGEDNHWVTLYGFEDGKYWKIFDSYDNTHKKLVWNFDFGYAKRYYVEKRIEKKTLNFSRVLEWLKKFFKL